jgi:oligopeptide transport system ATP-binding protein
MTTGGDDAAASAPLVRVENLSKVFTSKGRVVHALNGVSLTITAGEIVGLVGESGCGKTTLGRSVVGLLPPSAGRVAINGEDLATCSKRRMRELRRHVQILFQDPATALNPAWTVRGLITEPLKLHGIPERDEHLREVMSDVGLSRDLLRRRPAELSGGQRQRVALARAIVLRPQLLVLDEPTASVDMALRLSLLRLLLDIRAEHGMSYLFISHDLATVRHVCDRLEVMYLGRVVERGPTRLVFENPSHVYSRTLLSALSTGGPLAKTKRLPIVGEPPSPARIPAGCPFHPRCSEAQAECLQEQPFRDLGDMHEAACRLAHGTPCATMPAAIGAPDGLA